MADDAKTDPAGWGSYVFQFGSLVWSVDYSPIGAASCIFRTDADGRVQVLQTIMIEQPTDK